MEPNIYLYRAIVRSVYDGDTMRLDFDLGFGNWMMNKSVRLYGIDTPEIRGEERPEGLVARDFVREKCPPGSEVTVLSIKDTTGKYGRYLVTIFYEDPSGTVNLNEQLLLGGMAQPYPG